MLTSLSIERFKSIRRLHIACRRVNLFIGEPNVGKSNLLETLGLLSWCSSPGRRLQEFVRLHHLQNLFYDGLLDDPVRIEYQGEPAGVVTVKFENSGFLVLSGAEATTQVARLDHNGNGAATRQGLPGVEAFRFYRHRLLERYDADSPSPLLPPDGRNLFSVVYGSKTLRECAADLFRPYGLAVVMKPHEKVFEIQKQSEGIVVAFPFTMASDTLQRVLFYEAAMTSNSHAVLVFEEPEAHAFPFHTKHLGERIAMDAGNQYFVATHNPYLLSAIVEKAKKEDVAVFVTYYRDFETRVRPLDDDQMAEMLSGDPFFMSERFVEETGS